MNRRGWDIIDAIGVIAIAFLCTVGGVAVIAGLGSWLGWW